MLKIQSDRVIIDGHEPTKEQCETMTLLANALAESESFKTVKYESGYAEFEKVGKADELKFVRVYHLGTIYLLLDLQNIAIGGDAYDTPSSDDPPTITIEKQKLISTVASFAGITNFDYVEVSEDQTQLIIKDGYEIELVEYPDIVGNGGTAYHVGDNFNEVLNGTATYISLKQSSSASKVSVDLTTLPGWSSLSSGSHNITIVAKADGYRDSEPSAAVSVEKAAEEDELAGTWVFNDTITDIGTTFDCNFECNGVQYIGITYNGTGGSN